MSRFKRVLRVVLFLLLGVIGCFGVALLAINLYIQSPGIQRELRESVSESLDLPIDVFRITFTPWGGLNLDSVTVGKPGTSSPVLQAKNLRVRCDYDAFFRRKIIIREILLQHVDITIPIGSTEHGTLLVQEKKSSRSQSPASQPSISRVPAESAAALPSPSPLTPQTPTLGDTLSRRFWVEIQKFKLRDAAITVVHPDGSTVALVHGLDCILNFRHGDYLGRAHAENALVVDSIQIDDIGAPVKFQAGVLTLNEISASVAGGELTGELTVDFNKPGVDYRLQLHAAGVDLNEVASRTNNFLDRAHGSLEGTFELSGSVRDSSKLSGLGTLEIKSAYLDQYPLMQEIGRWTQIDELQRLDLERAVSNFRVVGPNIQVDSIRLVSKNCQITLNGQVEDAHRLALDGRLTVSQFLSQKIPNELEDNFQPATDGHSRYLDFHVSGSFLRPESNLFEKIVGDRRKLWQRLLHGSRPTPSEAPTSE
ncbi:MAG: AsmA family protein [Verrucomicrobia bacterium]|nr:AsmA family protein [Verrucomicrobiota bacterium]